VGVSYVEKSFCHNGGSKKQLEQGPDPGKHGVWLLKLRGAK